MKNDGINWAETSIPLLFGKIFIPTLLGMLTVSSITIVDGVFVGRCVGSDALAAVNIVAPFFMFTTGVGLMFGIGASIVASMHMSKGQTKAANINITQALVFSTIIMLLMVVVIMSDMELTARIMGSNDHLMQYVKDYMYWIIPALPFGMIVNIGLFIIRLDASPIYAMLCNLIPGALNVLLDFLLVYVIPLGIGGAALATGISQFVGCVMVMIYLLYLRHDIRLYPLKLSKSSLSLAMRNLGIQARLGAPGMIGELAIACMMFVGNYMFMKHLGKDGVAAFSVVCYCFPLVFMLGNAIAQSAQPIISYNYGAKLKGRVWQILRLSIIFSAISGIAVSIAGMFASHIIISLFIPEKTSVAFIAAQNGFVYFSTAFLFFTLNVVCIGCMQSMGSFKPSITFMILRGLIFVVPLFILLPEMMGSKGLWLAVPFSEMFTFAIMALYFFLKRKR